MQDNAHEHIHAAYTCMRGYIYINICNGVDNINCWGVIVCGRPVRKKGDRQHIHIYTYTQT